MGSGKEDMQIVGVTRRTWVMEKDNPLHGALMVPRERTG